MADDTPDPPTEPEANAMDSLDNGLNNSQVQIDSFIWNESQKLDAVSKVSEDCATITEKVIELVADGEVSDLAPLEKLKDSEAVVEGNEPDPLVQKEMLQDTSKEIVRDVALDSISPSASESVLQAHLPEPHLELEKVPLVNRDPLVVTENRSEGVEAMEVDEKLPDESVLSSKDSLNDVREVSGDPLSYDGTVKGTELLFEKELATDKELVSDLTAATENGSDTMEVMEANKKTSDESVLSLNELSREQREVSGDLLSYDGTTKDNELLFEKELAVDKELNKEKELVSEKEFISDTQQHSVEMENETLSNNCTEITPEDQSHEGGNSLEGLDHLNKIPINEELKEAREEGKCKTVSEALLPSSESNVALELKNSAQKDADNTQDNSENCDNITGDNSLVDVLKENSGNQVLDSEQDLASNHFDESGDVSSMENDAGSCSTEKFIDAEQSESKDSFSKIEIEVADMSAADTDEDHVNQSAQDDDVKSDATTEVAMSESCDEASNKTESCNNDLVDKVSKTVEEVLMDTDTDEAKKNSTFSVNEPLAKPTAGENYKKNDDEEEDNKADILKLAQKCMKTASSQNRSSEASLKSAKVTGSAPSVTRAQKATKSTPQVSKGTKQQECIVCRKMAKCKYNIVRNDDTKHLCDDKCFQMFRTQPTTYLQADAKKPVAETCAHCQKNITANAKAKNSLKMDKEIKRFCSAVCLNTFNKLIKPCASCGKDLRNAANAFIAPVEGEGNKDFCCHACLVKYEHSKSKKQTTKVEDDDDDVEIVETTPAPKSKAASGSGRGSSAKAKCAICSKSAIVRHEANFKGQIYKLCSDACLSAFRVMHHLSMNQCENCNAMFSVDGPQVQTIQFEGSSKTFCSSSCLSAFRGKKQRFVQCTWCSARKSNFDMVERVDASNKYQMFCSLNCLSLYRVNLQANSNQSVACDQCRKSSPAQYHLTMSDASVRNFCGYNCVMAFQAQFSQPSATSSQLPTPGNQVTANAANTQPAQSAVPPAQPARQSPYGTRHSSRAAKSTTSPMTSVCLPVAMPVISNIVSLAPALPGAMVTEALLASNKLVANIGIQTMSPQEVIVQPSPPKQVKNKALLCKPYMQTKATSCRPHTVMKGCQTDENWEPRKMVVPCPVPSVTPAPMMMYSSPVPYPILLPIPVPIPVFIPTTKKSTAGIMKKIKELQERVPSDPFEAELLMMAEAVANANKAADSGSESSDDDQDGGGDSADNPGLLQPVHSQGTNGELAEDMLQMALRMAEMQNEQTLDLEDAVDPTPLRTRESVPPVSMPIFDTIAADSDILQASHMMSTPRGSGRGRGKRRGGSRGGRGSSTSKKPRIDEETVEPAPSVPVISPPVMAEPPADANCILKFTYGVNAYKNWAIQKNVQLERISPPKAGLRQRLFKLDLLQCSADELNYALCLFVKEVRKPNGEEYAPDSIFYLCLGIQEYLYENGRIDNIFTDFFYEKFTECLNEVLSQYEVRLNAQGMLVCRIEEEHLWEAKQLGAHSPHVLLNTLIYFNTKHFMLRTPEEHLGLSFSHIMKHWKKTNNAAGKPGRSVYLRYYAPSQLGGDAAQKRKKEELPVFEQAENVDNPLRCPVKLYEFYLSKCPESIKNRSDVFYLVPERSCVPDSPVWYSTISLGLEGMTRMLNRLRVVREIQESQLTSIAVPFYN